MATIITLTDSHWSQWQTLLFSPSIWPHFLHKIMVHFIWAMSLPRQFDQTLFWVFLWEYFPVNWYLNWWTLSKTRHSIVSVDLIQLEGLNQRERQTPPQKSGFAKLPAHPVDCVLVLLAGVLGPFHTLILRFHLSGEPWLLHIVREFLACAWLSSMKTTHPRTSCS